MSPFSYRRGLRTCKCIASKVRGGLSFAGAAEFCRTGLQKGWDKKDREHAEALERARRHREEERRRPPVRLNLPTRIYRQDCGDICRGLDTHLWLQCMADCESM